MADEKSRELRESRDTLTDDQITTESTRRRRSFLTAVGALVAGGAVSLALGGRAAAVAQNSDPDRVKDPDKERRERPDPDKERHMRHDPDKERRMRQDPDRPKPPPGDPDH